MELLSTYNLSFKERCIADFIYKTENPNMSSLTESDFKKLSKYLWLACKKLMPHKLTKSQVIFDMHDVRDLVKKQADFFEDDGENVSVKGYPWGQAKREQFDDIFHVGRFRKEYLCVIDAWNKSFNTNQKTQDFGDRF